MMRVWCAFLFLSFVVASCKINSGDAVASVMPRDTTITTENAYTPLMLDSNLVKQFLEQEAFSPSDSLAMLNFYNNRNYQYAWFDEQGLTEQGRAFWNLHEADEQERRDTLPSSIKLHHDMTALIKGDTSQIPVEAMQQIELRITQHFFTYMNNAFRGRIEPEEMQWHIPRRKVDVKTILDSFLTGSSDRWTPQNHAFVQLENKLREYARLAQDGGWPELKVDDKKLKKGDTGRIVQLLGERLAAGDYYRSTKAVQKIDDSLVAAIKRAQQSFGLAQNGIVDKELIEMLNIPVEERIKQMKINLERMRWMPDISKDRLLANIPDFNLHVVQNNSEVMTIPIVVGKAANRTVIFSDELEFVVFSPYWNVPESIVKNEIVPAMKRDRNYLARNNMEIIGTSNGLPMVRQLPGSKNSLGKVKFIFPNPYNIYFHDTPAKSLFNRQQRAFSHGCMRLQRPLELAQYLLRNDTTWTKDKIIKAMNQETEKWVPLKKPLPVYVVYFTSWVDEDGLLHFRKDVYGHDERMAEHLFN